MIEVVLTGFGIALSPCGGNGYYDPNHQICQPYPPPNPPPGYDQICSGGFYDPLHKVCAPYEPPYPPTYYHRRYTQ